MKTFIQLLAAASMLMAATIQAEESNTPTTQVVIGDAVIGFEKPPRLLNLYQAAELPPSAYWPSSRLLSAAQTEKLQQRRDYVLGQLTDLAQSAFIEGDEALEQAARAYAEQLPKWPLVGAEWIGRTKIDDRLDQQSGVSFVRPSLYSSFNDAASNLQANPQLPADTLQLLPPKDLGEWQVTIVAPEGIQKVAFEQHDTVREVLKKAGTFEQYYDLADVTLISLTGLSRSSKVAYYNDAEDLPPVHGIIFVGLDLSAMDDSWQRMNAQLAALLSYWNPQS
jgi:hypothetical protein